MKKPSPSVISILPLALILALPGWVAVLYLLTQTSPTLSNRWFFYVFVIMSLSGTFLPVITLVNRFLQVDARAGYRTVVREALMVGVYGAILLWLNKGQVLSIGLAVVLALGIFLAELLVRLRNRSKWEPGK